MHFPSSEQLNLPCTFAQVVPGQQHSDGRRYLPLIVLQPAEMRPVGERPAVAALGVVDRHHVVDLALEGRAGVARLVFLLSTLRLQAGQPLQGLLPEEGRAAGRPSIAPTAYGRVVAVLAWETRR